MPENELDALPEDDELAALPEDDDEAAIAAAVSDPSSSAFSNRPGGPTLEEIDALRGPQNSGVPNLSQLMEPEGSYDPMSGASPSSQRMGGQTLGDIAISGAQGASMNYGDEIAGLVGGEGARNAFNDQLKLANQRSPIAAPLAHVGGELLPSLAIPGAGLAANVAKSAVTGGLAASGNAVDGQRLAAGGRGALTSGLTTGVLGGAGKLSEAVAPHADKLRDVGLGAYGAYQGYQHGGLPGAVVGFGGGTMASQGLGRIASKLPVEGMARTLGTGLQSVAQPAGVAFAEGLSDDYQDDRTNQIAQLAHVGTVNGRSGLEQTDEKSSAAARAMNSQVEAQAVSQASTNQGRGNLLGDAAVSMLHTDPSKLGEYQGQFAKAYSNQDLGAMNALITKLSQKDPKFRTTTLVELQKLTSEGR